MATGLSPWLQCGQVSSPWEQPWGLLALPVLYLALVSHSPERKLPLFAWLQVTFSACSCYKLLGWGGGHGSSSLARLGPCAGHRLGKSLGLLPSWLMCFVPQFPCLRVGVVP